MVRWLALLFPRRGRGLIDDLTEVLYEEVSQAVRRDRR